MADLVEILLADDSDVGRYVIATTLRRAGFEVREVQDGIEALHEVKLNPPDLAILDVKMPGLDGLEVCARIKADPETSFVPVLLLSATFLDAADRVEGLETGADAYLTQPVEAPVLIASIRSLLRVRSAERAERLAATEWQVTFDSIGDAVALIDAGGAIRRCNRAFSALVGLTPTEAAGRRLDEIPQLSEVRGACERGLRIPIGGRTFTCRVDTSDPETGQTVLTLRDVTAESELERERERALTRERLISRTLQEALAPGRLPSIPGLALSARYVLGETDVVVGGDWFDVIPTGRGIWLTIGDNSGHGVIATARAVQLRNSLRLLADEGYGPAEAMTRLSGVLSSAGLAEIASALIVSLGHGNSNHEIVCAGHPPALRVNAEGRVSILEEARGPVLGFPGAEYRSAHLEVASGDTLLLYTDGLIERRGETIDDGIARLAATIAGCEPMRIAEHAFSTLLSANPSDDAAILVAQLQPAQG